MDLFVQKEGRMHQPKLELKKREKSLKGDNYCFGKLL